MPADVVDEQEFAKQIAANYVADVQKRYGNPSKDKDAIVVKHIPTM